MTTQESIDHIGYFGQYDLQSYFEAATGTFSNANKVFVLNWGVKLIGKFIRLYKPNMVFTIAEAFEHDIRKLTVVERKVVDPMGVIINGVKLCKRGGGYGIWKIAELEDDHPTWMADQAATPLRAAVASNKLYLHPKPTAAVVAAGNNFIMGTYLPKDRTADADVNTGLATEPELPDELHEAACYFAAVKAAIPNVSEADAWNRIQTFNAEWVGIAKEIRRNNTNELINVSAEANWDLDR